MKSGTRTAASEVYALVFGLFLGLCLLKFGNPVILDQKILPPANLSELWGQSWPTHWANWMLWPMAAVGALLISQQRDGHPARSGSRARQPGGPSHSVPWLFILPLLWLGWQLVSATQTVDKYLTAVTLWQFFGCAACYFIGAWLIRTPRALHFLAIGILAAFTICLIRAVHQRIEFPQNEKFLLEGQRAGWTNVPPALVLEMKRDQTIITTNGVEVLNPGILARFAKDRVMGTMVYPNALAGIILLLFPFALALAFHWTRLLRPIVRVAVIAVGTGLCGVAFFWSGSKFGWLIAIFLGALCLFRLRWPVTWKVLALAMVVMVGLGVFAVRFHSYFEKGATSATARLDYWRAAAQTTGSHPLFGTGPGTFQRPYARLKSPQAEMARLAHNDYLEQFSDSGIIGGTLYIAWIAAALVFIGQKAWRSQNQIAFALFLGLLGWFIQGLGEFGQFIPASAWTAFTLLGLLLRSFKDVQPHFCPSESIRQKKGGG